MWFIYQMLSSFVSRAISSETILIIIDLYHLLLSIYSARLMMTYNE